jgi:hypothetical protein
VEDEEMFAAISDRLVDVAGRALGPWVAATVARFGVDDAVGTAAAAERCAVEITAELRDLLAHDVDRQRSTPLAILRGAGRYPSQVLAAAGVPKPYRDPFDARNDPDDVYGVSPATWSDLGDEMADVGIAWGAAKAHLHLRRHKR